MPLHRPPSTSICSGLVSSIQGPPRSSITPRHWWVAAVLMVGVYLSITVVVYRIGIRLGAAQPVIALACVFVAFSPFLSTALIWWGAALCLLTVVQRSLIARWSFRS